MEAPRYQVLAMPSKGRPRAIFSEGTEEPEPLAAWVARVHPDAKVTIIDRYAGTSEPFTRAVP